VLDNAHSVDQVRDLVPGTATCQVLSPAGHAAGAGCPLRRDPRRAGRADDPEAVALLGRLLGSRVDDEPAATRALAERCARLPLAVRIAAELAAARPAAPLARLVADLDDEARRLDLLAPATTATLPYVPSSPGLQAPGARGARGVRAARPAPGRSIQVRAAAALLDTDVPQARRLLEPGRAHLITEFAGDRFEMHDLLRAYAGERAAARADGPTARFGCSNTTCARAPAAELAAPHDPWLDEERGNLSRWRWRRRDVAAAHSCAVQVSRAPFRRACLLPDGLVLHESAVRAARRAGTACRKRAP